MMSDMNHGSFAAARSIADPLSLDAPALHAARAGRADAFCYGWSGTFGGNGLKTWAGRLYTKLTGNKRVTPFADPRLERLRLFVCMVRRDDRRMTAMAEELATLGYSRSALREAIGIALA